MSGNDGRILVTGADLEALASDLKSANQKIEQRLGDLHSNLMKIFGDDWKGAPQVAYTNAKNQWDKQMDEMKMIMQDAHNNVLTSKESYEAADKKAAGFF